MKIERFSQYIKESLSKSLEEYCYELFDVGYKVHSSTHYYNDPFGPKDKDFFILTGYKHEDDVQKFIDIVESMESKVRASYYNDEGRNIILCISKEYYNDLSRRFDLYFKYVNMEIIRGDKYFFYSNSRNRVDPYDGVEIKKGDYCIACESNYHGEDIFLCNQNYFWDSVVKNKIRTNDYPLTALFLKMLFLDNFEIEIDRPVARFVPPMSGHLDASWRSKPYISSVKSYSLSDVSINRSKEKAKKKN